MNSFGPVYTVRIFKKLIETMCNSPKLLRYYRPDLDLVP